MRRFQDRTTPQTGTRLSLRHAAARSGLVPVVLGVVP
jgi:hypothetical protein